MCGVDEAGGCVCCVLPCRVGYVGVVNRVHAVVGVYEMKQGVVAKYQVH